MRTLLVAATATGALFGALFGLLEGGLASPSQAERTAMRELRVLGETRTGKAELHTEGRVLHASCRPVSTGTFAVRVDGGSEILVLGVHVRVRPPSPAGVGEAVLAGVHALYARLLTVRLANRDVELRTLSFFGRPAYSLRLTAGRPEAELVVDRETLAPLGAVYRSHAFTGSSRFGGDAGSGC